MMRSKIKTFESYTVDVEEALDTPCQTNGAVYNIGIQDTEINVHVKLPFTLNIPSEEAATLEANIHNAMEVILSKYFDRQ